MAERAFHHGSLRAELLDRAEVVLREQGLDALSLRELARDAGVSHGAPRSHFIDRGALLDALAERGFLRLADEMRAGADEGADAVAALRSAGRAYLAFSLRDAALLDLMFAAKMDEPSAALEDAAGALFATLTGLLESAAAAGAFAADEVPRLGPVLSATVQGLAVTVAARRMSLHQAESALDDAIDLVLGGLRRERLEVHRSAVLGQQPGTHARQ